MFNRVRPFGHWTNLTALDGTELEQWDSQFPKCIDGDLGGRWDPSAPIVIGGAGAEIAAGGLTVSGGSFACNVPAVFNSTSLFGGSAAFAAGVFCSGNLGAGSLNVFGTSTFAGAATFTDAVLANAGIVALFASVNDFSSTAFNGGNGSGHFDGLLSTNSNLTVGGAATVTGAATFSDSLHVAGSVGIAGDATLGGILDLESTGRIKYRVIIAGDEDINETQVNALTTDILMIWQDHTLSVDRSWTIGTAGASNGMIMHVSRVRDTNAHNVVVKNVGGGVIVTLDPAFVQSAIIVYYFGVWFLLHKVL